MRCSVERRVRFGEWAGRDLSFGGAAERQRNAEEQKREKRGASGNVACKSNEPRDERGIVHAFLRTSDWEAATSRPGCLRVQHSAGRKE